jgi:glycosyltransferase 2 family protein
MRESPTRWLRAACGVAIIALAIYWIRGDRTDFALRPIHWHFDPLALVGSIGLILASFVGLIGSWWFVARGWRQGVPMRAAARAWGLTNRARYFPTHGAAVERMATLAVEAGVSTPFAVGAAILPRLITLAAASAVASGLYVLNRMDAGVLSVLIGCVTVAGSLAAAVLLTSADICFRISIAIHRPNAIRPVEPDALGAATLLDIAGFLAQGAALRLLALAVMSDTDPTWWVATGSFAAAYVVGRLLPVLPSGLLVREAVLVLLLRDTIGTGPALLLAFLWRGILTLTELGAAAPFQQTPERTT